jgi:hypothetical protein
MTEVVFESELYSWPKDFEQMILGLVLGNPK